MANGTDDALYYFDYDCLPNGHGSTQRRLTIGLRPDFLLPETEIIVVCGARRFRVIEEAHD